MGHVFVLFLIYLHSAEILIFGCSPIFKNNISAAQIWTRVQFLSGQKNEMLKGVIT